MSQHEQALQKALQAAKEDPSHGHAWLCLGNTRFNLEQYDEAVTSYEKALELGLPAEINRTCSRTCRMRSKKRLRRRRSSKTLRPPIQRRRAAGADAGAGASGRRRRATQLLHLRPGSVRRLELLGLQESGRGQERAAALLQQGVPGGALEKRGHRQDCPGNQ